MLRVRRSSRKRRPTPVAAGAAAAKKRVTTFQPTPVVIPDVTSIPVSTPMPIVSSVQQTLANIQLPVQSTVDVSSRQVMPANICQLPTSEYGPNAGIYSIPCNIDVHTPTQNLSIYDEISINVPQNIKEKIANSEYIELATLLSTNATSKQKLVVHQGELIWQTLQNTVKIVSIEQWTKAFMIFTSVYCTAHPNRFQELLKYMYIIRLGTEQFSGLGWKVYDEQYRLRKARNPASSWATVDLELWLLHMNANTGASVNQQSLVLNNGNFNLKCYSFNYTSRCYRQSCPYSHTCLTCSGMHPVVNCPVKGNIRQRPALPDMQRQAFHQNARFGGLGNQRPNLQPHNFTFRYPQQQPRVRFNQARPLSPYAN